VHRVAPEEGKGNGFEIGPVQGDELDRIQKRADRGELEEACEMCERFLHENPMDARGRFLMALIYHAQNDLSRAEECLNKVIYLDPLHDQALEYLIGIAQGRGDRARAEQLRQRVQRIRRREKRD
jgi:chemotaxis protein methyltransferase WspC